MRILVYGLVGSNLGGIETFLLNMNAAMSSECIFDYVIEGRECIHEERIHKKGGAIYYITPRTENVQQHLKDIVDLNKRSRGKYETIYFNLSSASWILPELIAKRMGYKVVVHSHNAMLIDANHSLIYRAANSLNRRILGHINVKRLACSDLAAKFLFGNGTYTLIYNGIEIEKYEFSAEKREIIRGKYNIDKEAFVVGVVGRLAYQKNPLFSIEIFAELLKQKPDSYMFMIGDGNLREEINNKIKDLNLNERVILTGNILNVEDYLNAMDCFLLPSRHEGLGIALIEAQTNGLPCITSENVVPLEAKATDLLEFINIKKGAKAWADMICKKTKDNPGRDRRYWCEYMESTNFNIAREAVKLEKILGGSE